jgi:ABC-type Fe3+/spermidine/putrescine transport system ATPase subunit
VDLEIREGSFTAILGPSGCGKTTLLRCLAGLVEPDAGRIFIGGADVTRWPPNKRNLGFVFQRPAMFPHMTVYENIAWALQLRKWPKAKVKPRVQAMLRLVRLEGYADRRYRELSGGQAQRVVIARALAPEPDVLFLDEPLSQLDAKLRDELKLEIAMIHRATGCTTLMVTHDQAEALTIADNVLFIGTNNFLEGTIAELGSQTVVTLDGLGLSLMADRHPPGATVGMPVWVCVRADDIDVIDEEQRPAYANVVEATVEEALLTGGNVIVQAALGPAKLRIHVGGNRRFQLLGQEGKHILCYLGNINLIARGGDELPLRAGEPVTAHA